MADTESWAAKNGAATAIMDAEENSAATLIDFKMVTFSLGGKDYGIDIMQVKEIAKFHQFTYVPNTAPYVRGVYNLRGEIISIVDLRLLFNLPVDTKDAGQPENGLILRLENNTIGVIVDSIDRVVGLSSAAVQPPHPIFADINIKYIQGVAQYDGRLYIVLDVERVFEKPTEGDGGHLDAHYATQRKRVEAPDHPSMGGAMSTSAPRTDNVEETFVAEGLEAFTGFVVSPVNDRWFSRRLEEWTAERSKEKKEVQLGSHADAELFLNGFYSRRNGAFLDEDYGRSIVEALGEVSDSVIQAWNPGTGNGYEAYSLAALLHDRFPDRQIKIWAGDNDLLKISNAPNMVFEERDVPDYLHPYLVAGPNGYSFGESFQQMILFEFSDIRNSSAIPRVNVILARDVVSFLSKDDQIRVIQAFEQSVKPEGVVVLGDRERPLPSEAWSVVSDSIPSIFRIR